MKHYSILALLFVTFAVPVFAETLTVYTYDSLVGKHSLGEQLSQDFEKKQGAKIHWVPFASEGEALNQIKLEKDAPVADLVLGVDNSLLSQAKASGLFDSLANVDLSGIGKDCTLDSDHLFLPFDYGYLAFIYNQKKTKTIPKSLKEFTSMPKYKKSVVLEDPRTSSIGLGFLVWTHALFPEPSAQKNFWNDFSRSVVTYSPGWSGAYGLFLKGEAQFVLSYTTSPAYHIEKEKVDSYKAVLFPEGHYRQVEFVGMLKSSSQKELSRHFIKLLLSKEIQEKIPQTQWMYPVRSGVALPKSFQKLSVPKAVPVDITKVEKEKKDWLGEWALTVVKAQ